MKSFLVFFFSLIILTGDVLSETAAGSPVFTPYGAAQYRFRVRSINEKTITDTDSSQLSYVHQIGYFAGLKVKLNDQVSFQFQIGNDYVNTEQVSYLSSNHAEKKSPLAPYFHLAYAKWDPKYFNISVGIVPENSYGTLDLLERSLAVGDYGSSKGVGAGQFGWLTGTNGSITGLKLGVPVLNKSVKLGVEVLATIVDDSAKARSQSWFADVKSNPSQQLYIFDVPFSVGGLTVTPQVAMVLFRKYNYATQKGDNEVDFGFGATYKFNDIASVRANAAYGTFDNSASRKQSSDTIEFKRIGRVVAGGATVKVGPGNVMIDASISSDENTKTSASSLNKFYFGDLKYVWSANKYFEITPRVRIFRQHYPSGNLKSKTETRPEIIFTGKF